MPAQTNRQPEQIHITAKHRLFDLHLSEVWKYKDLIFLYAKRSLVVTYKQTLLGPIWLILGPFITSIVYMVIFGNIAGLSQTGVPMILFYLYSQAAWGFVASITTRNSDSFSENAYLYGKVYFPRLTIPLSHILVALFQFVIQFGMASAIAAYFLVRHEFAMTWIRAPLILLLLVELAALGLGVGLIVSSLSNRYKDLRLVISFAVRLWMFLTPVVYPLSEIPIAGLRKLFLINPATAPLECLRWCLWGKCTIPAWNIVYSAGVSAALLFVALVLFNRVERTFIDTV